MRITYVVIAHTQAAVKADGIPTPFVLAKDCDGSYSISLLIDGERIPLSGGNWFGLTKLQAHVEASRLAAGSVWVQRGYGPKWAFAVDPLGLATKVWDGDIVAA